MKNNTRFEPWILYCIKIWIYREEFSTGKDFLCKNFSFVVLKGLDRAQMRHDRAPRVWKMFHIVL